VKDGDTTDAVIELGRLSLAFGRVDRITYHDDGVTPESDTDHTVMLGLVACSFAAANLPDLDVGLIAQYALVHDVVEVYAGDTPTLHELTPYAKALKEDREAQAYHVLLARFSHVLPWLPETIADYERREIPEARYVKAMDKLLPKITHLLNGGLTLAQQGMNLLDLVRRYDSQLDELLTYAEDFPPLFELRAELVQLVLDTIGGRR